MSGPPETEVSKTPAETSVDVARVRWWVAGLTFVAGAVIGVLVTGLLIGTTPEFGTAGGEPGPAGPSNSQSPSLGPVPVTAQARVNAACLRVINEAQDVYRVLSGADKAARDVDLQQLDDIVRRLQPVQERLERDLQECRVDTSVVQGSSAGPASPIPTVPQPSSSSPR